MKPNRVIYVLILLIIVAPQIASAKSWGSHITPQLINYCKNAGGTPKEFGCTATDTCAAYLQRKNSKGPLLCGEMITADCDCGPQKCLKDDKCITNPE